MPDKRRSFWRVPGGVAYHRDRQCAYIRLRVLNDSAVRFLAVDPGLGGAIPVVYRTHAIALRACPRCGT